MIRLTKIITALIIIGAVFCFSCSNVEKGQVLEIRDAVSGKVYGRWPLKEAEEFAIEFIHSVHQSPVKESFRIENGVFKLASARFNSFGAGMQSDLEEGQRLIRDGDAFLIVGYDVSLKELNYIVGTVSDHLLYVNNEILSLRDICGRNAHINIRIKR